MKTSNITRFRNTVESPNDIKRTVNSIFNNIENCIESEPDPDPDTRDEIRTQRHTIKKMFHSLCSEAGMSDEEIEEYIESAINSGSDKVTIEINYSDFGRVGIDVTDGRTDVFSSTYDNYRFSIPKSTHQDSISDLKDKIDTNRRIHDDGVGFALYLKGDSKRLRIEAHVFDRPNEILLQRENPGLLKRIVKSF